MFAKRDSRWLAAYEGQARHKTRDKLPKSQEPTSEPSSTVLTSYQLSTKELAALPFIVREAGSGTRQIIDEKLLRHLPGVKVIMEIEQSEAIKRMVSADIGLGCLSQHVIEQELATGELVQIEVAGLELSRQWWLVWHQSSHQSPLWHHFVAILNGGYS